MMIEWLLLILAGAIVLDLLIGDPRWLPHPVVGMGKLIYKLEQTWNHGSFRKGKGILAHTYCDRDRVCPFMGIHQALLARPSLACPLCPDGDALNDDCD